MGPVAWSATAAHPRACGENASSLTGFPARYGSSPRVRGKRGGRRHGPCPSRLIPARAGKTSAHSRLAGASRAHPRACGENMTTQILAPSTRGSSPRVRGKPSLWRVRVRFRRLIPARAGKTLQCTTPVVRTAAHPRACGENRRGGGGVRISAGSSPRVRGKRRHQQVRGHAAGLIPARAGKTVLLRPNRSGSGAHPRACGENSQDFDHTHAQTGSSPRVRGKPARRRSRDHPRRLIPARAGKTYQAGLPIGAATAHPRACGENAYGRLRRGRPPGSSPRVRGKRRHRRRDTRDSGLIPARAGKTATDMEIVFASGAHPRACGENCSGPKSPRARLGSSPRVRGKPPTCAGSTRPPRLIPARAGKTAPAVPGRRRIGAHPRACGENREDPAPGVLPAGSSPRVRGKPRRSSRPSGADRLIPARAGKTQRQCGL